MEGKYTTRRVNERRELARESWTVGMITAPLSSARSGRLVSADIVYALYILVRSLLILMSFCMMENHSSTENYSTVDGTARNCWSSPVLIIIFAESIAEILPQSEILAPSNLILSVMYYSLKVMIHDNLELEL